MEYSRSQSAVERPEYLRTRMGHRMDVRSKACKLEAGPSYDPLCLVSMVEGIRAWRCARDTPGGDVCYRSLEDRFDHRKTC